MKSVIDMVCSNCGCDVNKYIKGLCLKCYDKKYKKEHRQKYNEYSRKYYYKNGVTPMNKNTKCTMFLGVHVAERVLSNVFKNVERMPYSNKGFDFICNKGKKIDVKSSIIHTRYKQNEYFSFTINKNEIVDFFLCLAFDNRDDLNPLYIWLIPGEKINNLKMLTVSLSTLFKFDEYKLDLNKIIKCCDTLKAIKI